MIQAFYSGVSGVASHQSAIDVTADNLSNINTVGYRAYTAEFASLFDNAMHTDLATSVDSTVGVGTRIQATKMSLLQGSLMQTERNTDLALAGEGWFGVSSTEGDFYTRAGNITFDENRDLVNPDGMYVLGTIGKNINFTDNKLTEILDEIPLDNIDKQQKIQLPNTLSFPPNPTKNISFEGNLGTDDELRVISANAIDKEGNINKLKLVFTLAKEQPDSKSRLWDVKATVSTKDEETIYSTTDAQVLFDETGGLKSSTLTTVDNNGSVVNIDLGKDFSGVISIANVPVTGASKSDGNVNGELIGYDINANGEIIATFTNGKQSSVAQVAVYHFQNDQALNRVGDTLFQASSNSGKANFYKNEKGENVLGTSIMNYTLENSNMPIESGLTELIIYQRAYDANAKSITTADQMIQKALQMDA